MIFPNLIIDSLVQICDMFRIDASRSFVGSGEAITSVKIYPDYDNDNTKVVDVFVEDCPEDWFLDWAYETNGAKKVRLEIETATDTKVKDYNLTALNEEEDNLQATDAMIYSYESELKRKIPLGRNSWKYAHRKALEEILDYLYRRGILNPDGTKIEKSQLIGDKLEKWATFEAMLMIYQDIKGSNIDYYNEKLEDYSAARNDARKIYCISYDSNKDGNVNGDDVKATTRQSYFSR